MREGQGSVTVRKRGETQPEAARHSSCDGGRRDEALRSPSHGTRARGLGGKAFQLREARGRLRDAKEWGP